MLRTSGVQSQKQSAISLMNHLTLPTKFYEMFSLSTLGAAATYDHTTDSSCFLPEHGAMQIACSKENCKTDNWRLKLK
jgi:hypothetical protein